MQHDLRTANDSTDNNSEGGDTTTEPEAAPSADDTSAAQRTSTKKRSLTKTLSWRVTATTTTFLIAWAVTGDIGAGAAIGGVEAVAKMFLYYGHERAWERVPAS